MRAVFRYGQRIVNHGTAFYILHFICFLRMLVSGKCPVKDISGCPVHIPAGTVILDGYSLIYIGNEMIEALAHKAGIGMASAEYLPVAAGILSCFVVALVGAARCALLLFPQER